jgi:hypothetical protein
VFEAFRKTRKAVARVLLTFRQKYSENLFFPLNNSFNPNTNVMNAIELIRFRNAEYLQYMTDFAGIINLNDPASLQIDAKLAAFVATTAELEELFKKASANDHTKVISALDQRRDDAINGITAFLQGYSYHYEEDKKQNAQKLLTYMAIYGSGIARQNYQAETATLNNMIRDFADKPELAAAVAAFGLQSWIE